MISQELNRFYERWRSKANDYQTNDLQDYFDKFFTLYVAYNRLYAELTLSFIRRGLYESRNRYLPDAVGAKRIVHEYLGTENIWSSLENDNTCKEAITSIIQLIDNRTFAIKLDKLYGEPIRQDDLRLLEDLNSGDRSREVSALLDIIYSIRCNMFHGHKGFNQIQTRILDPVIVLLEKISDLLYQKMSQDDDL